MSEGLSLHGKDYYQEIRNYRDLALEESHWIGQRKRLGKFVYGAAQAWWRSESGGRAHLIEEGIRYDNNRRFNASSSTILDLYDSSNNKNWQILTRFEIDVDGLESVRVSNALIKRPDFSPNFAEFIRIELSRKKEKNLKLDVPTDDDRLLLYEELRRGASGMYPLHGYPEDDDDSY